MLIHIPQYPQFAASKNMAEFDIYHMTIYDMIIYWRFVKEKTMIRRNSQHGQMHLRCGPKKMPRLPTKISQLQGMVA